MKIKKVLCLGAVLGAVLSVGMVVSASAATAIDPSTVTYPEKAIPLQDDKASEYPLYGTKGDVTGTIGENTSTYDEIKAAGIYKVNESKYIKLNIASALSFYIDQQCFLTVSMDPNEAGGSANLFYTADKETPATKVQVGDLEKTDLEFPVKVNTSVVLDPGYYYITGPSSDSATLDEIEFRKYNADPKKDPTKIITISKGDGSTGGSSSIGKRVAIIKDTSATGEPTNGDPTYYAVVLVKAGDETGKDWLTLTSGEKSISTDTLYTYLKINDLTYDAEFFGASAKYLCAFKLDDPTTLAAHDANPDDFVKAIDGVEFTDTDLTTQQ